MLLSGCQSIFICLFQIRMDTVNKQEWHTSLWTGNSLTARKPKMSSLLARDLITGLEMVSFARERTFGRSLTVQERSANFSQVRYFLLTLILCLNTSTQPNLYARTWRSLSVFLRLSSNTSFL